MDEKQYFFWIKSVYRQFRDLICVLSDHHFDECVRLINCAKSSFEESIVNSIQSESI